MVSLTLAMKYKLENMVLNVNQMTLKKADSGELISSDEKLIAAMNILVTRYPEVVTKEELIKEIWPRQIVTDWSLTRFMSDMRKVLGDKHNIKTVHGRGYRYTYPVVELNDTPEEPFLSAAQNSQPEDKVALDEASESKPKSNKRIYIALTIGVFLTVAFIFIATVTQKRNAEQNSQASIAELMDASNTLPVIAVIPVVDRASRYETGLAMASLINGMLKLHDGIYLVNEAAIYQHHLTLDLARTDLKQQLDTLCAATGCTEVILLHYADNSGKLELGFNHYRDGEIFISPEIVEKEPLHALERIYTSLESRLPKSSIAIAPLLYTNNGNSLLAFGEATGALAKGDLVRAKYNLEAAIRSQPDFYPAITLLANVLLYRDKNEEARALVNNTSLENANDYEKLLINIVRYRLEWHSGNHEKSLTILDAVKNMSESFSKSISAQTLLDKGIILHELGDDTQALDLFKQSMTLAQSIYDPEIYSHSLFCQAELFATTGNNLQAELLVEKANTIFERARVTGPRSCTQRKSTILHN